MSGVESQKSLKIEHVHMPHVRITFTENCVASPIVNKNSSGDEIANVNFFTTSHM